MRFYDAPPAPSPRKVRMFIAEKGIEIDTINVDIRNQEQLSNEFRAINPGCTVPVLQLDDGACLTESTAICHYLESIFADPPLMGRDAMERALVLMWNDSIMFNGFAGVAESLRNGSEFFAGRSLPGPRDYDQIPQLVQRGRQRAEDCFDALDARLADSIYLAGQNFSYADICAFVFTQFAGWIKLEATSGRHNLGRWYALVSDRASADA